MENGKRLENTPKRPPGRPRQHGLSILRKALRELGNRGLYNKNSAIGKYLAERKESIIKDLGGPKNVSVTQEIVIDRCMEAELILRSIMAWAMEQPSLINKTKRTCVPVVKEWFDETDRQVRWLQALGLEKKVNGDGALADLPTVSTVKTEAHSEPDSPI